MTDLCDEEEAAAEARKHINFATEVDPSNPEGWQVIRHGSYCCRSHHFLLSACFDLIFLFLSVLYFIFL